VPTVKSEERAGAFFVLRAQSQKGAQRKKKGAGMQRKTERTSAKKTIVGVKRKNKHKKTKALSALEKRANSRFFLVLPYHTRNLVHIEPNATWQEEKRLY
jgi:hypothetical protein